MIKILFICHGNICRSPMAEFIMRDMVSRRGVEDRVSVSSAATSGEELGNPVYPPARRVLAAHGINCDGKFARRVAPGDYDKYDMLICMEKMNIANLMKIIRQDPQGKVSLLLDHAGRKGEDIPDPWYTGRFDDAWREINAGCEGLLENIIKEQQVSA